MGGRGGGGNKMHCGLCENGNGRQERWLYEGGWGQRGQREGACALVSICKFATLAHSLSTALVVYFGVSMAYKHDRKKNPDSWGDRSRQWSRKRLLKNLAEKISFWLLIRHHNYEAVILIVSEKTFFASIELVSVIAWFVVIFGINTTSDISKLLKVIWDNFEISQVVFMPNITYKSCYCLFILLPAKGL